MPTPGDPNRRGDLTSLGAAIRRRRAAKGWTLTDLATEAGVSRVMLVAIENGTRNAGVASIFKIATALDTPVAELFADADVGVD